MRRAPVLLVLLTLAAIAAVVMSRRTDPDAIVGAVPEYVDARSLPVIAGPAPLVAAPQWLNSAPLGREELRDKVVLYDFWTFGCINCKNTLPYVKAWHERYAPDGLVLLSIHTPEFSYEAVPESIAKFVTDNHLSYPVALDTDKVTWRAFGNRYWPAFYLHDREGNRRYQHFGEGSYERTENAIRALLGVPASAPRSVVKT